MNTGPSSKLSHKLFSVEENQYVIKICMNTGPSSKLSHKLFSVEENQYVIKICTSTVSSFEDNQCVIKYV
jgi:predicted nucleic-acid-binding Zn-ribbon protein